MPAELDKFFNQGVSHGSVDMAVRVFRGGVLPFVLHQGGFKGCGCGFVLVHEPFGICVAHSHVVYSDAVVLFVVFDDHSIVGIWY